MIRLVNVSKTYVVNGKRTPIAKNINAVFPDHTSVALLGRNGAGKSSLLRIVAGTTDATSGQIQISGSVSWPVGFSGSFHPDLTGAQNTKFIARIYGIDTQTLIEFVKEFAELGHHFWLPFRTYSAGMKSRLAFGISMGIEFDTYLVDEVTSVGDIAFREKSVEVFKARMRNAAAIVVSHSLPTIHQMCTAGAVLENGVLTYFDDLEEAISLHTKNMKRI